jgi:DNA-binding NarL/FixJ family response regulator
METVSATLSNPIRVLVAESNPLQSQLLVTALRRRPEFRVTPCEMTLDALLAALTEYAADVIVMNADDRSRRGLKVDLLHQLHRAAPAAAKILLLREGDRDAVISAFRAGARGLFSLSDDPFRLLCKCIQSVHDGQIWLNNQQVQYLVESLVQVPSLRVVDVRGSRLLTPREEQVVALVADGLSNRDVAQELKLSEHTVKKYLFRIFEKLGISSRVELVLYAVNHGESCEAEWIPGGAD